MIKTTDNKLLINQSLIKKFLYRGEVRDYCPYSIYCQSIIDTHNIHTNSVIAGSYFETQCLGSGVRGNKTDDMPRKNLTKKEILSGNTIGSKTVDHQRIDKQVMIFEQQKAIYQINVQKEVNTQVRVYKPWERNNDVILNGEYDIFPTTILLNDGSIYLAAIDLKLTKTFTDFGEYCWLNPTGLDLTQAYMYHELARDIDIDFNLKMMPDSKLQYLYTSNIKKQLKKNNLQFLFWVFEYSKEMRTKFINVSWNPTKRAELFESIRLTIEEINKNEQKGWMNTNPIYENCKKCPVFECPNRIAFDDKPKFEQHEEV